MARFLSSMITLSLGYAVTIMEQCSSQTPFWAQTLIINLTLASRECARQLTPRMLSGLPSTPTSCPFTADTGCSASADASVAAGSGGAALGAAPSSGAGAAATAGSYRVSGALSGLAAPGPWVGRSGQ